MMLANGTGERRVVRMIGALWLALMLPAAQAARFVPVEDECNGRQLLIQGPIETGDYQRFVDFMAGHVAGPRPAVQDPDVLWTVELDSSGGDVGEALRIGRFLRQAYATTEVGYRYARRPDGVWDFARSSDMVCLDGRDRLSGCHADLVEAECTGACLLIWLGGATRYANEGRLGTHGLAGAAGVTAYLAEMDVPAAWRARLGGAAEPGDGRRPAADPAAGQVLEPGADPEPGGPPAAGDGWLAWAERRELDGPAPALERLIAGCPAPLGRDESYRSVTAPSAAERDALMDRAEAHRSCRRSRLAAARSDTVARLRNRHDGTRLAAGSQ